MQVWCKSVVLLLGLCIASRAIAQEGSGITTYTPYSLYGLGDFASIGTSTSLGMGGITMGTRNTRAIDLINPSGASARDSLSFIFDFGGEMRNVYAKSSSTSSSSNSAFFHHLAFAFPILGNKWGVSVGFMPFTSVGYDIEQHETNNDELLVAAGDVLHQYKGEDGISQGFLNIGYNLSPNLSLGIGGKYYFGTINRYYNTIFSSNATYNNTYSKNSLRISDFAFSLGAHYTKLLDADRKMIVGLTLSPPLKLSATETILSETRSQSQSMYYSDTAYNKGAGNTTVKLPTYLSVGLSFTKPDNWLIGADFVWNDWSKTEIAGKKEMGRAYDIKVGGYYIPNRYDIRYYTNRITYRAGLRYSQTAMIYRGESVKDKAVSVGLGFPLRSMGDLNLSVELGQRGALKNEGIVENYVNFTLSLTIFEYWFVKYRYE